jgi:hypothetical protein
MSKWNDETEATLVKLAGEGTVSQDDLESIAEAMEITKRSVGSKLRKMDYDVQRADERASAYTSEQEDEIRAFLAVNHGTHTYAQLAAEVCDGQFEAKQIQGKILSMELTGCVAPTPKKEVEKKYSDSEQETVLAGCLAGNFLEDIAKEVGKSLASVRGKALSLFRAGSIDSMPTQKNKKATADDPFKAIDTVTKTVEELSALIGKTVRGVKVMLTNRKLSASDYAFKAKAE